MKIKNLIHTIRTKLNIFPIRSNPDYKEIASMGAWGNYIATHLLSGRSLEQLHISKEEMPRLIKQAEDYEKICATAFTECIKS